MDQFVNILRKYGRPMSVSRDGKEQTGRAMVQPLFEKDRQWLPSPLGNVRQDRFLCLAEPQLPLEGADYAQCDGISYDILTAHPVPLGEEVLYQWAVLNIREGEA